MRTERSGEHEVVALRGYEGRTSPLCGVKCLVRNEGRDHLHRPGAATEHRRRCLGRELAVGDEAIHTPRHGFIAVIPVVSATARGAPYCSLEQRDTLRVPRPRAHATAVDVRGLGADEAVVVHPDNQPRLRRRQQRQQRVEQPRVRMDDLRPPLLDELGDRAERGPGRAGSGGTASQGRHSANRECGSTRRAGAPVQRRRARFAVLSAQPGSRRPLRDLGAPVRARATGP